MICARAKRRAVCACESSKPATAASFDGSGRPEMTTLTIAGVDLPALPNAMYSNVSEPKKSVRGV